MSPIKAMPLLIDIGANLTHEAFNADRAAVITRAQAVGITQMIVTGTSLAVSHAALQLAHDYPKALYATAGIHPHEAAQWQAHTATQLAELAVAESVVAMGEMGLDFNRDFSPRPIQERVFEAQLELAVALNKPVFLHERDAHSRFMALLMRYRHQLPAAVLHCFTGTESQLAAYLDLDLHIGITGWLCDERRGTHLRELVAQIPLNRLMIETDAPYLLPRNVQPKPKSRRNEPAYLTQVLRTLAASLALPADTVATATTQTAQRFFGIEAHAADAAKTPD